LTGGNLSEGLLGGQREVVVAIIALVPPLGQLVDCRDEGRIGPLDRSGQGLVYGFRASDRIYGNRDVPLVRRTPIGIAGAERYKTLALHFIGECFKFRNGRRCLPVVFGEQRLVVEKPQRLIGLGKRVELALVPAEIEEQGQ
jgi:hypothetical protein